MAANRDPDSLKIQEGLKIVDGARGITAPVELLAQAGASSRRAHSLPPSGTGLTSRIGGAATAASLLDVEPELGRGIESQEWELARGATRAKLTRIDRCELVLPASACDTGNIIGLIVKDGMISREVALGEHVALELLTPGDVLLPPAAGPDELDLGGRVTLTALNAAELVVLSKPFIYAAARWPSLLINLSRRLEAQRRRLALQGLAVHLPRAEDRLLLILWILADSCGRVTPEGTDLPLSLSHEVLGRLAAARRPTVTLALRNLESAKYVQRRPNGHLTLRPAANRRVQELTHAGTSHPPIGPSVALHEPVAMAAGGSPVARNI